MLISLYFLLFFFILILLLCFFYDIDLNFYSNQPHTVVLGVVQVADAKVFVDWLTKPEAVLKTLVSGKAATEVLKFERYVVSPVKKLH